MCILFGTAVHQCIRPCFVGLGTEEVPCVDFKIDVLGRRTGNWRANESGTGRGGCYVRPHHVFAALRVYREEAIRKHNSIIKSSYLRNVIHTLFDHGCPNSCANILTHHSTRCTTSPTSHGCMLRSHRRNFDSKGQPLLNSQVPLAASSWSGD